jgi:mannose-1-phosphate guanylyltransferase
MMVGKMRNGSEKWSAVILAGGLGSRLSPLTAEICKPAVPVTNRPMVDYAIDHLRYAGIKKIIIVVKHLGDELRDLINSTWTDDCCKELEVEILVPKVNSLGTADAVRKVAEYIDTEHFVVSMADIITNLPMRDFMDFHEEKNAQASVSMKNIDQMATKYGNTLLDGEARITRFLEKPSSEEIYLSAITEKSSATLPIINTGIYCFKREILDLLNEEPFMDFGRDVFPYLLENRYSLYGFVRDYYWLDVGNPLTYLWSNWDMLRLYGWPITPPGVRQGENNHVWYQNDEKPSSNVKHGDHVVLGKENTYGNNVFIKELTSIGSNVTIANNVNIDRAVIWDNVKIGNGVKIENSVIANNCVIGDHCTIKSDTIIGPNCTISPNTTLDSQVIAFNSQI